MKPRKPIRPAIVSGRAHLRALMLCAPVVAKEVQSLEDCCCSPDATDASDMDAAARPDYREAKRAHEALVRLGVLSPGRFAKRPTRARKVKL